MVLHNGLYDESRKYFGSEEEILSYILEHYSSDIKFSSEVPNENVKGLCLEFLVDNKIVCPSTEKIKHETPVSLSVRLIDGDIMRGHYFGWLKIGEFKLPEIAKNLVNINKNLEKRDYLLELERAPVGGNEFVAPCEPYLRIKTFSIPNLTITRR